MKIDVIASWCNHYIKGFFFFSFFLGKLNSLKVHLYIYIQLPIQVVVVVVRAHFQPLLQIIFHLHTTILVREICSMDSHLTSMLVDPPIGVTCGVETNDIWIIEERCPRLGASYKPFSMLLTLKLSLSQCHIVTTYKIKPKKVTYKHCNNYFQLHVVK